MILQQLRHILSDHIRANQFLAAIRFATSFIIGVILVNSYFTDSQVGSIEYIVFLAANFSFFLVNSFSNTALSFVSKRDNEGRRIVLSQFLWTSVIAAILVYILVWLFGHVFLQWIGKANFIPYLSLIALLASVMVVSFWAEIVFLIEKSALSIIRYSILMYALKLALVLTVLYFSKDAIYIIYVYILWECIKFLWGISLIKPILGYITWRDFKFIGWMVSPLLLHFLFGKGIEFINGNLVATYFGEEQFLYYQYGAREIPFSQLFLGAMAAAFIPLLAENFEENLTLLKERLTVFMRWIVPLSIALMCISPYLFTYFYNDSFVVSAQIFNIFILYLISRFLMPHIIIYAKGDHSIFMFITAIELVLNLILALIMIPHLGLISIAIAAVFSGIFHSLIGVIYCRYKYQLTLSSYLPVREYLLWMGLLVLFYLGIETYLTL